MILQKEAILTTDTSDLDKHEYAVSSVKSDLSKKIDKIDKRSKFHSLAFKSFLVGAAILLGVQAFSPRTVDIGDIADKHSPTLTMVEKVETTETIKKVIPAEVKSDTQENKKQLTSKNDLQKAKEFEKLTNSVTSWVEGTLGKMIAIMALLLGGALAVVKNSPMPALTGVALATFLNFGPSVVAQVLGTPLPTSESNTEIKTANKSQINQEKPKDTVVTEEVKTVKDVERKIVLTSAKLQCFMESNKDCMPDTSYGKEFKTLVTKTIKENNAYSAYYSLVSSKNEAEFNNKLNAWNYKNQSVIDASNIELTKKEVNSQYSSVAYSSFIRHLTLPVIFLLCVGAFYTRKKEKENRKNKEILQNVLKVN